MNWKFKGNCETIPSGDFWYDLTRGGYIKPEELLEDESQISKLNKAINLISSFESALEEAGIMEEC